MDKFTDEEFSSAQVTDRDIPIQPDDAHVRPGETNVDKFTDEEFSPA